MASIDIVIQYFDECPNWRVAEAEVTQVVADLGLDAHIARERIESQDDAQRRGFRGSPTILVSGHDPFADEGAPVGLSCRVYRTGARPSGSPGVDALRRVLGAVSA